MVWYGMVWYGMVWYLLRGLYFSPLTPPITTTVYAGALTLRWHEIELAGKLFSSSRTFHHFSIYCFEMITLMKLYLVFSLSSQTCIHLSYLNFSIALDTTEKEEKEVASKRSQAVKTIEESLSSFASKTSLFAIFSFLKLHWMVWHGMV